MTVQSTCHPDRQHRARGLCTSCYTKDWQHRNPERNRINRDRAKAKRTPAERKDRHLKHLYGLSLVGYERLLAAQDGRCAVCGEPPAPGRRALAVDHDHQTGRVRGLLCGLCNRGVGAFRDNPEFARRAASYLEACS
jgi:hypothetical protein